MGLHSVFEATLNHRDTLSRIETAIWKSLIAASVSHRHAWHEGCLQTAATNDGQIAAINGRTVVLRSANSEHRTIDCHTDVRSQKVSDISSCSIASWMFYDARSRIQLRVGGEAMVINDTETDAAWDQTGVRSRSSYLSKEPPGTSVDQIAPPSTDDRHVSARESNRGRQFFRIVRLNVATFDWLYLRREGHLRMSVDYSADTDSVRRWIVP